MRKNNPTSHISDLLNQTTFGSIMKGNKMEQVIKHSTLFSFWNNIVGAKFARFTKPYSIKCQKLYVSAKSPVIIQELNLYKAKILRSINSYSMPLGIEIKDIIFNYKNYTATTPEALTNEIEDKPVKITDSQLQNIELDAKTETEIKNNIDSITFLNKEQKEKFVEKILNNEKAKHFQNKN